MIKLTYRYLSGYLKIKENTIKSHFKRNGKTINNLNDIVDYVLLNRLKK